MSLHVRWRRVRTAAAGAAAVGLLAAGCADSDSGNGSGSDADSDTLIVYTGLAGDWQRNYNPYSTSAIEGAGAIFESLFFFNQARPDEPAPRLGTEYSFNEDGTELSISLREGVQWSDGEDFTADDVAFTFDMLVEHDAVNTIGFDGVTEVVDPTHVKVTFEEPAWMDAPQLLGKIWIVPEHVWSGIEDPAVDPMHEPVGTGPFVLGDFKPQAFTLDANPGYWDGEPELKHVRYVALSGNQAGADALAAGQIDWMTGPVPDIANVERDYEGYKAVTVPLNQTVLITCSNEELGCEGPQTSSVVRHAIYRAMDRNQINSLAFQNTSTEVSPGFALPERDAAVLSNQLNDRTAPMAPDADGAKSLLEEDGWELGGDGIYEKDGEKLSLSVRVVSGWTDYITALDTMTEQLKAAGIELNVQQASWNETTESRNSGDYQLMIDSLYPGPSPDPYYVYNYFFHSDNTVPVGESANPNFARYSNPEVDQAIEDLAQINPEDAEARQPHYDTIQTQIERDMPYIPIMTAGTTSEYHASKFTGWPTEVNLYAVPAVWSRPDQAEVFRKLAPAGE